MNLVIWLFGYLVTSASGYFSVWLVLTSLILVSIVATGGAATVVGTNTVVNGQYGVLTISGNGDYSYVRNAGSPGDVTDTNGSTPGPR